MLGMEMLLSNMFGIKPEEMQTVVKSVIATIEQAGKDIQYIRSRLDEIHPVENGVMPELEEGITNGGGESHSAD